MNDKQRLQQIEIDQEKKPSRSSRPSQIIYFFTHDRSTGKL